MVKRKKLLSELDQDDLVFKAMAGADRRRILDLLHECPMTTGEICTHLNWLDRCTVMQHLGVLEKAGLVISRKKGRCRWNYLDVGPIQRIHERWISDYTRPAARVLSRIRADLESL
jgi:DNA-binding transcriptional ArsR family regulator